MADFEEALNSLLADPDAMGQIMSLAGKLGMGTESPPSPGEAAPSRNPPPRPPSPQSSWGRWAACWNCSRPARQSNQEADALIAALRPFLREERQKKLDQAIQLAGLSRAARQAYRLWKEGELHL